MNTDRLESEMRQRFDALTFVSEKSYLADRAADERVRAAKAQVVDDYAKETRSIAEGARTVAWAVAVLLVGSLAGLLAIIKAVAG